MPDYSSLTGKTKSLSGEYNSPSLAKNKLTERDHFVSKACHELRNPISSILGFTKLLKHEKLSPTAISYLESIEKATNGLKAFSEDVLESITEKKYQFKISEEKFQLTSFLINLKRTLKFHAENKGLKLIFDISPDLPEEVIGDPMRVSQILTNLIINATKFTETGWVELAVSSKSDKKNLCEIQFSITDTGIGIADEQLNKIFEDSYQISPLDNTQEGFGLGLTITKELVDLLKGKINVKSKVNEGTCFTVNLPFKLTKIENPIETKKISPNGLLAGKKILFIEDNELVGKLISKNLLASGAFFCIKANGFDAYYELIKTRFDLIISDLEIPGISGWDLVEKLKNNKNALNFKTPIIVTSSFITKDDRKKAAYHKVTDLIEKTYSYDELIDTIFETINKTPKRDDSFNLNSTPLMKENPELLIELTALYAENSADLIPKLKIYLENADEDSLRKVFHRLLNSTKLFGMGKLTNHLHDFLAKESGNFSKLALSEETAKIINLYEASVEWVKLISKNLMISKKEKMVSKNLQWIPSKVGRHFFFETHS